MMVVELHPMRGGCVYKSLGCFGALDLVPLCLVTEKVQALSYLKNCKIFEKEETCCGGARGGERRRGRF